MKNLKLFLFLSLFVCSFCNVMQAQSNKVNVGEALGSGTGLTTSGIVSGNKKYLAEFKNGKIVISEKISDGSISGFWREFYSYETGGEALKVQDDGNLVSYKNLWRNDAGNTAIWASGTNGRGGSSTHLQIQNDGNLVLYNGNWMGGDGDALWATGTCGGKENGCGGTGTR